MSDDENSKVAAERAFAEGFFVNQAERVREEHAKETPLHLAYALRCEACDSSAIRDFALAIRRVGDKEPIAPAEPLTPRHSDELRRLTNDRRHADPLREVLQAALPKLEHRRDLYALIGIMLTTADQAEAIDDTVALASR